MDRYRCRLVVLTLTLMLASAGAAEAQADSAQQSGPPPHAIALAEIGRSGLRSLISASGSIGDLQNRAGSYRMAVQQELARVGPLNGRIAAIDAALSNPHLPNDEREGLLQLRGNTLAELEAVPRYEAEYSTATVQAESLLPMGFLGGRPLFALVRGRGHLRGRGPDGLTVFSQSVSVTPVVVGPHRWIFGAGIGLGRTDVNISAFDGSSVSTSMGPELKVGGILGAGWSVVAHLGHSWSHGSSTIFRPSREQPVEVRSAGRSQSTTARAEVKGRLALADRSGIQAALRPSLGAFLTSTRATATTNNLGETSTGPFGERESVAALRVGASVDAGVGAWSPTAYLGWERELTNETSVLVRDPNALVASAGLSWTWNRGRRLALEYSYLGGLEGLREASGLTLVLILDR